MAFLLTSTYSANTPAAQHVLHRWEGDAISVGGTQQRFRWSVERCGDRLRSEWRNSAGALVAWDEVISRGASFGSYRMAQTSSKQRVSASLNAGKIVIEHGRPNGTKGKRQIDTRGETVLAGPMLIALVQESLTALRNGEAIVRSYLVPEQSMLLRLIARRSHIGTNGNVSISIQAATPLLRPFVPTTVLEFDSHDNLIRSSGRILATSELADLTTSRRPGQQVETSCES
jgi:hypothetical protein